MKPLFLTTALLLAVAACGQQIDIHKTFGGIRFQRDTITLTMRQVSDILGVDPQAAKEFKMARSQAGISSVLGFAGGFLLAFPIGTAIAGGEPEWGLAGAGAVLILASVPITMSYKRHAEAAVARYNATQPTTTRVKPTLSLRGTQISLTLRF